MCMPIINPMYLYLIDVLHNIDVFNQGVFFLLTVAFVAMAFILAGANDELEEGKKDVKRWLKIIGVAWLVSFSISIFVPTKDMMYKMLIASYVTTDNIQIVNEAIKTNLQDYLNMLGETVKNMR